MATSLGESLEMLAASCHGSSMRKRQNKRNTWTLAGIRPRKSMQRTAVTTQSSPIHTNLAAVAKLSVPALQLLEHLRRIPHRRRQHQIHEHTVFRSSVSAAKSAWHAQDDSCNRGGRICASRQTPSHPRVDVTLGDKKEKSIFLLRSTSVIGGILPKRAPPRKFGECARARVGAARMLARHARKCCVRHPPVVCPFAHAHGLVLGVLPVC